MSVQHIKEFLNLILQEKLNMTQEELDSFWKKASVKTSCQSCTYEFTKGKRKGEICGSKCKSGSTHCLKHSKVKQESDSDKQESKSDESDSESDSDTKKKLNTSINKCVYTNDDDVECGQKVYEKSETKKYCYKHRKHDKSE
jgi:hypothetical protein